MSGHLDAIYEAYSEKIAVTLTESSSNIVVRSENQFHGEQRHRMSLRKHLYELHASSSTDLPIGPFTNEHVRGFAEKLKRSPRLAKYSGNVLGATNRAIPSSSIEDNDHDMVSSVIEDAAKMFAFVGLDSNDFTIVVEEFIKHIRTPFDCQGLESKKLAKYLGFVDLRTNSPRSPIALALLVPPRDLRHDQDATIIQGLYGRLFGGHTFPCSPFSMHDPTTGGAYCAQACLIMVLTILADRGARIVGSFDLTIAALFPEAPEHPTKSSNRVFPVKGLRFDQMQNVLNSEICGSSSMYREFSFDLSGRRALSRLIDAYVSARCPVILGVHTSVWNRQQNGAAHTLVVVGFRRNRFSPREITELIIHDPSTAPYIVRPIDECVLAATPLYGWRIPVIFSADQSIEIHAATCLDFIYKHHTKDHHR